MSADYPQPVGRKFSWLGACTVSMNVPPYRLFFCLIMLNTSWWWRSLCSAGCGGLRQKQKDDALLQKDKWTGSADERKIKRTDLAVTLPSVSHLFVSSKFAMSEVLIYRWPCPQQSVLLKIGGKAIPLEPPFAHTSTATQCGFWVAREHPYITASACKTHHGVQDHKV